MIFFVFFKNCIVSNIHENLEADNSDKIVHSDIYNNLFNTMRFDKVHNEVFQNDTFNPLKFWYYRRFLNLQLDAHSYLFSQDHNHLSYCLLASLYNTNKNIAPAHTVIDWAIKSSQFISQEFIRNKYRFSEMNLLENTQLEMAYDTEYNKKDILTVIESGNKKILNLFFEMINNGKISLREALPYLQKIASIESRALKLLGDIAYYGVLNEQNIDLAMDCYWAGSEYKNEGCYIGLGKIMETDYNDTDMAIEYYEKSLKIQETAEGLFALGNLTNNNNLIAKSAYKGYIPAMTSYFNKKFLEGDTSINVLDSVLTILKYHPHIMIMKKEAEEAYESKNYAKAFLIYAYLSEYGLDIARKNLYYLVKHHQSDLECINQVYNELKNILIKNNIVFYNIKYNFVDIIYYDNLKEMVKYDTNYNKDLGLCYYHGIGIEKSLENAISCYHVSPFNNIEACYYLAKMFENGEGIKKDIIQAIKTISIPHFKIFSLLYYILKIRFIINGLSNESLINLIVISIEKQFFIKIGVTFILLMFCVTINANYFNVV